MLGAMLKWIYDGSTTDVLKFERAPTEFKQMIEKDGFKKSCNQLKIFHKTEQQSFHLYLKI